MIEKKALKDKKGQVIIVSLLFFFVALVIVSILLEPIMLFVEVGVNATNTSNHADLIATLMRYIPVFIVLVLVVSLFMILSGR